MQLEHEIDMLKDSLLELSKALSPYVVGAEGNVSGRMSHDKFLIKASGECFSDVDENSFVECDLSGRKTCNSTKIPSIESPIHAWLYDNFNVNFIAHTHPMNTLKILCSNELDKFSKIRLFPDQVVFNGSTSYVVDYDTPGVELLERMKLALEDVDFPRLILLQNHGIFVMGKTIRDCVVGTQICEKSAEIYLGAKLLGLRALSDENISQIDNNKIENYRRNLP